LVEKFEKKNEKMANFFVELSHEREVIALQLRRPLF